MKRCQSCSKTRSAGLTTLFQSCIWPKKVSVKQRCLFKRRKRANQAVARVLSKGNLALNLPR